MMKRLSTLVVLALLCQYLLFAGNGPGNGPGQQPVRGTYSGLPRLANDRADLPRLLAELKDIHANTYNWLIWTRATDWEDLQAFLPMARKAGITVWVTLVPHSESPPHAKYFSEPFRLDFERWAKELAALSLKEPALTTWSIDDFVHNLQAFTPEYVGRFIAAARAINPKLAFIPCCYYRQINAAFSSAYAPFLSGVLFPYRAESVKASLADATQVKAEIDTIKQLFGASFPVVLDIYATAHSRLGASTPGYVKEVLKAGMRHADGVFIYCHQDPATQQEKYAVIREGFARGEKGKRIP
ncbi:hypothetical protein [Chitinophaga alhagiae]|uniref:hypothetical protein n=1 Tax=Chitinophaga alhagiae TaxID=2203219 RepID=UPI000E5C22BE|nr:hypothetical protein [Chitinophaga alhagiae]